MCIYSKEDIKAAIQRAYDLSHPLYCFCNPKYFELYQKELSNSLFEVVSSEKVEENKIYIINKADLKFPFENSDIPRIDLTELKQFINEGGDN